jgi:uncharacterized protein (TIGR00159 family)
MIFLFQIGFLPVRIVDVLDVLIVGYLMYQIYKLLRGTIAFNIFIGVLTLYIVWWMVGQLQMELLSKVLTQFVNVGVILIVVIFQEEIRRFLLFLGNNTLNRQIKMVGQLFNRESTLTDERRLHKQLLKKTLTRMSRRKTGALVVLANNMNLEGVINEGVELDANISESLLESIFNKESPLHDGAVIIANGKIQAASCILPISDSQSLPGSVGMRHRAAVGLTERANVAVFIVSEENGRIAMAEDGKLHTNLSEEQLETFLEEHYKL